MLLQLLTIAVSSLIIYEDFRHRLVRVILYVLMFVLLFVQQTQRKMMEIIFLDWLMNIGYLMIMGLIVGLYFFIRYRTFNFVRTIGFGDVLLLAALALWFEPIEFVFFNTVSFLIAFVLHFILRRTKFYSDADSVPLAGMQCICFIPFFVQMTYSN
jgi:Flp pilus assembly protein protease CpaA